jgi:hypothetical protein
VLLVVEPHADDVAWFERGEKFFHLDLPTSVMQGPKELTLQERHWAVIVQPAKVLGPIIQKSDNLHGCLLLTQ